MCAPDQVLAGHGTVDDEHKITVISIVRMSEVSHGHCLPLEMPGKHPSDLDARGDPSMSEQITLDVDMLVSEVLWSTDDHQVATTIRNEPSSAIACGRSRGRRTEHEAKTKKCELHLDTVGRGRSAFHPLRTITKPVVSSYASRARTVIRRGAIIAASSLASCAPTPRPQTLAELNFAMIVGGDAPSLAHFESVALKCGAKTRRMEHASGMILVGVERRVADPVNTPSIDCVTRWVLDHPEGLGFVGNDRRD